MTAPTNDGFCKKVGDLYNFVTSKYDQAWTDQTWAYRLSISLFVIGFLMVTGCDTTFYRGIGCLSILLGMKFSFRADELKRAAPAPVAVAAGHPIDPQPAPASV